MMPTSGLYPVIDAEQTMQMIETFGDALAEATDLREEWEELSGRVYVAQEFYECSVWAVEDLQSQINRVMNPTVETVEA